MRKRNGARWAVKVGLISLGVYFGARYVEGRTGSGKRK
jgi:hypothetical protein